MVSLPDRGPAPSRAARLNADCVCTSLLAARLHDALDDASRADGMGAQISATRPNLFSAAPVFISRTEHDAIAALVSAVERVVALPSYQRLALARAAPIAHHDFGTRGGVLGFDFHLGATGPQLIEVNTNPGGALLNLALLRAQQPCVGAGGEAILPATPSPAAVEDALVEVFRDEWRRQRGAAPLRHVVVVDDAPQQQYLYPEFRLYERLLSRHGLRASVADASALRWRDGRLWLAQEPVDLIYNRLTDFYLDDPVHAALRNAYESGAVVLTPSPRAHALYANKRNLASMNAPAILDTPAIDTGTRTLLQAGVPATQAVTAHNAALLWSERAGLFFKPASGYGSRAVYRGDKLTRRVWGDIVAGDYVAQALVTPGRRMVDDSGVRANLKFDLRAYAFAGRILLFAARLYQGQTTNFRTPGGGFAPVFIVDDIGQADRAAA
ncbi:MAG: hypothetical protein IH604_20310 [Burkholderiales bacterium]|nr:hypothetical protein [Burkholderiales bacterium]